MPNTHSQSAPVCHSLQTLSLMFTVFLLDAQKTQKQKPPNLKCRVSSVTHLPPAEGTIAIFQLLAKAYPLRLL